MVMVPSSKWMSHGMDFVVTVWEECVQAVYVKVGGEVEDEEGWLYRQM